MSANHSELFTAYVATANTRETLVPFASERRRRPRIRVHWPVLLFRSQAADAVASATQNLSSSGFYCLSKVEFVPGETLICSLKVPVHEPSGKHLERNLECKVRVLRVETHGLNGDFGLACHIEDYHFAGSIGRK